MEVRVLGMKRWQGVLDGKSIDSGKLYVEVKLDSSRNDADSFAVGVTCEEVRVHSSVIRRLESVAVPFAAELVAERVSNGKTTRDIVTDVKPISVAKPARVA